ncbi:MAG: thermonuclease family protein [Thermoguttaceae bacterium]|nr:thermonuclease family protein [Thermoguttaceae bacterium]
MSKKSAIICFSNRIFVLLMGLALTSVALLVGCTEGSHPSSTHDTGNATAHGKTIALTSPRLEPGVYAVRRVVDGDTLLLENDVRIRLLGVDTPETVKPDTPVQPWGPEASAYTKNFCQTGFVRLEFDVEPTDKYGRYLAYVYDSGKKQMLNEQLLRNGLGKFLPYFPYADEKKKLFSTAQSEAQREKRGIWSESP